MNLKLDIDPHAVCRICLTQKSATNNLFNYFSNTVVEGYIISVPDMVMKCLDIEVKSFVLIFPVLCVHNRVYTVHIYSQTPAMNYPIKFVTAVKSRSPTSICSRRNLLERNKFSWLPSTNRCDVGTRSHFSTNRSHRHQRLPFKLSPSIPSHAWNAK